MKQIFGTAIAVVVLSATAQAALAIENRPTRTTEHALGGAAGVVDGTMDVQVASGCYALVTGDVQTANVGGTVSAFINRWDDGTFQTGDQLDFPGDGGSHGYCLIFQQLVPVGQLAPGLGVYLEDGLGLAATTTFDSNGGVNISDVCTGPAPVCPTSVLEVPAVDRTGFLVLTLLIAGAALFWLARRRTASPR